MQQVFERGGTIEVAVARPGLHDPVESAGATDLVWRLRVTDLEDEHVVVEAPVALGTVMEIADGTPVVGAITVGQNRWKFKSVKVSDASGGGARTARIRLELPDAVERCMRRHTRFETAGLSLPQVEVWPLLDPKSVVATERANEAAFAALTLAEAAGGAPAAQAPDAPMPQVGPSFPATLMNLGGGGVGLRVESKDSAALGRHRNFFLRIPLGAGQPVPIVASATLAHTHLDSAQRTYAGMAFDFVHNPQHQSTVVAQVQRSMHAAQSGRSRL
jgi:hypothetical protein